MAYEILNNTTGETEVLSDLEAERKYGAVDFTMMVAGINDTHSAVNLSVENDVEEFDIYDNTCDISEAFAC